MNELLLSVAYLDLLPIHDLLSLLYVLILIADFHRLEKLFLCDDHDLEDLSMFIS